MPTSSSDDARGRHDLYEGVVRLRDGEHPREAFERNRRRLFSYDIFPSWLMASIIDREGVEPGALIVQSVGICKIRLEFAVRVVDAWDREVPDGAEAGFTYVTLRGHAERGRETFGLRLRADGSVLFRMEAWSAPGTRLTKLGRPLARLIQVRATRTALRRVTAP